MAADYNVFISWSGERSRIVAEGLREWLPMVIQASKPWMSETDIEKGTRSFDEIAKALEGSKLGVVCVTPENRGSLWVAFEAGALSKTVDDRTRVCTYLIGGVAPHEITGPLSLFQATAAAQEDTRKMVHSLNRALGDVLAADRLNAVFDAMWPKMAAVLETANKPQPDAPPKRRVDDMVAEILDLVRGLSRRGEPPSLGADAPALGAALLGLTPPWRDSLVPSTPLAELMRGYRPELSSRLPSTAPPPIPRTAPPPESPKKED